MFQKSLGIPTVEDDYMFCFTQKKCLFVFNFLVTGERIPKL
jgi:hypothetical protein